MASLAKCASFEPLTRTHAEGHQPELSQTSQATASPLAVTGRHTVTPASGFKSRRFKLPGTMNRVMMMGPGDFAGTGSKRNLGPGVLVYYSTQRILESHWQACRVCHVTVTVTASASVDSDTSSS
jgi:hypothetical protein